MKTIPNSVGSNEENLVWNENVKAWCHSLNIDEQAYVELQLRAAVRHCDWNIVESLIEAGNFQAIVDIVKNSQGLLDDFVKCKAPVTLVEQLVTNHSVTVSLFNKIVDTYAKEERPLGDVSDQVTDIISLLRTCITFLKPCDLRLGVVSVDLFTGVEVKSEKLQFEMHWSPLVLPVLKMLINAGCCKPSRLRLLQKSYCFSDPCVVKIALELCDMLKDFVFEPLSLNHMCKIAIRNSMQNLGQDGYCLLGLPNALCYYLQDSNVE